MAGARNGLGRDRPDPRLIVYTSQAFRDGREVPIPIRAVIAEILGIVARQRHIRRARDQEARRSRVRLLDAAVSKAKLMSGAGKITPDFEHADALPSRSARAHLSAQ
jgi:hypothetical protein